MMKLFSARNFAWTISFSLTFVFFTFAVFCKTLHAERVPGNSLRGDAIELAFHAGKIFKHRDYFIPDIEGPTFFGEFSYQVQTSGDRHWHQRLSYPSVGMHVLVGDFGDRDVFGRTLSLAGSVNFMLVSGSLVDFNLRVLTGVGFIDRPYHPVENPTNNVIGSKLNNFSAFRFALDWKLIDQWTISTAVTYNHYSNGNFQKSNLGINVPVFGIGARYHYGEKKQLEESEQVDFNRFGLHARLGFGMNESGLPGGPKYPVYKSTLKFGWNTSAVNRVLLGFNFAYSIGVREFLIFQEITNNSDANREAMSGSIVVGNELLIGNVGLVTQLGIYVFKPQIRSHLLYSNIGLQYYPFSPKNTHTNGFFVGAYLKSHMAVADVIEFGLGWNF